MTTLLTNSAHPNGRVGVILGVLLLAAGCAADAPNVPIGATERASSLAAPPPRPAVLYLADLPARDGGEAALAGLFANGTADRIPVGDSAGYPVLFDELSRLNWLAAQLWGGKTFRAVDGETRDNGDPVVKLDNKVVMTPSGAVFDVFDADVTRSPAADVAIGVNDRGETVAPPSGTLAPVHLSLFDEDAVIDDSPSIVLNYFDDSTLPVIRRIFDEIREVDATHCPGLFLGRAHVRQCTSLACGELPSPAVDVVSKLTFETRYEWKFWTYFLLDFAAPEQSCDLTAALAAVGLDAEIPFSPAAE